MIRRLTLAGLLVTAGPGCGRERVFDPVQVDIAANCDRAEAIVTYADLDAPGRPWTRFIAASADAPGLRSIWALVEFEDGGGAARLGLWHLTEDEVDARVTLDLLPSDAGQLQLLPGAAAGVTWMLRRRGSEFYVARVERAPGQSETAVDVVQSGDLGDFPPVSSSAIGCDNDGDSESEPCDPRGWPKYLAIADGVPFLVTVPTGTVTAITHAFVGQLTPDLRVGSLDELQFTRQCDLEASVEELALCTDRLDRTSYPEIDVSGIQLDSTEATWSMFLLRNAAIDGIPELREPVVITLGLQDNGSPQGTLRARSGEATSTLRAIAGPPSGLAIDAFNSYLLHATAGDGAHVMRVSNAEAGFDDLEELRPLSNDVQILQLEGDVALGEIDGSAWAITKLFPDAPERSQTTRYEANSPIRRAAPAGPGSFLIEADDGHTLVSVSCATAMQPS